ncbi:MAG: methyltransferase domain-containing protein [Parcubacteria group bacterium]|nr:methyltransferase domain-containing protein [Parcubacteria group bacterium]
MTEKTRDANWAGSFFGGPRDFYGTTYTRFGRLPKDPEKEIDGVLALLKPEPGSHILDWCGGWGRHAIPLAKRGFRVTILDFSAKYLERAREHAEREGVEITTVCADFRDTPPHIQADYAVNLFTAGLGYFGEEDDIVALKRLFAALKPDAKVLIDTISLFWIVKNFRGHNWEETADGRGRFLHKRTFDFGTNTERAINTHQDLDKGTEETANVELKLYCPADLARILKSAGFVPQELYGGFDGSGFNFDAKRVVMLAGRP